jgi:hypothetical protein
MTNVLPPQTQKVLWQTYIARIVIVVSVAVIVLAGVMALAIAPAKLTLIISDRAMAHDSLPTRGQISVQADRDAITSAQRLLDQATPYMATSTSVVNVITTTLAAIPKGAKVEHITYTTGKVSTLVLTGSATRDQINAYKTTISADKRFTSVYVPVETLVGSQDRNFTMTLTGSF